MRGVRVAALVVWVLTIGLLLVAGLRAWRQGVATQAEYARERELRRQDAQANDALRAGLLARSGLDAAVVNLRAQLAAGRPAFEHTAWRLGETYANGRDQVEVRLTPLEEGTWRLEAVGAVLVPSEDWSGPPRVVASARAEARARVRPEGWSLSDVRDVEER